jgi:hypothetical protein
MNMRSPASRRGLRLDDEGAALAAMASSALIGVLVAGALALHELAGLLHFLPYVR